MKPEAENGFYIFSGSLSTYIISLILPVGFQNLNIYHLTFYRKLCQAPALEDYVASGFQSNFLPVTLNSLCVLVIFYLCDHRFLCWLMVMMLQTYLVLLHFTNVTFFTN